MYGIDLVVIIEAESSVNMNNKHECLKIAFYGKGGIGKSTIAANVSAAFSTYGCKALHIGCDPKADSTRCLMGRKIPTVIEQLQQKAVNTTREDVVFNGFGNIACIEAGGPEAGIGCAGRGIISMMEELEYLDVWDEHWDTVVYDVLGDVVCGGFAVPMREGYADTIYIVTSSEFMALYAANNIIKAVIRSQQTQPIKLGGLIYNCRTGAASRDLVEHFASLTGTTIVAQVPFAQEITLAELEGKTAVERNPDSAVAQFFRELASTILRQQVYCQEIKALNPTELEELSQYMLELALKQPQAEVKRSTK